MSSMMEISPEPESLGGTDGQQSPQKQQQQQARVSFFTRHDGLELPEDSRTILVSSCE